MTTLRVATSKCRHFSIFPNRHQSSIFDTTELNFCVRDGNRCTLSVINTNFFTVVPQRQQYYSTFIFKIQPFF